MTCVFLTISAKKTRIRFSPLVGLFIHTRARVLVFCFSRKTRTSERKNETHHCVCVRTRNSDDFRASFFPSSAVCEVVVGGEGGRTVTALTRERIRVNSECFSSTYTHYTARTRREMGKKKVNMFRVYVNNNGKKIK